MTKETTEQIEKCKQAIEAEIAELDAIINMIDSIIGADSETPEAVEPKKPKEKRARKPNRKAKVKVKKPAVKPKREYKPKEGPELGKAVSKEVKSQIVNHLIGGVVKKFVAAVSEEPAASVREEKSVIDQIADNTISESASDFDSDISGSSQNKYNDGMRIESENQSALGLIDGITEAATRTL